MLILFVVSVVVAGDSIFKNLQECNKNSFIKLKNILKTKQNLEIFSKAGQTPLTAIAKNLPNCYYNQNLAKIFIDKDQKLLDKQNKEGETPLVIAVRDNKDKYFAKLLIKEGADINIASKKDGKTALILATINSDKDLVRILCERYAKRDIKDNNGKKAIDYAIKNNEQKIAQMIYANKRGKFIFLDSEGKPIKMQLTRRGFRLKDSYLNSKKLLFLYGNKKIYNQICSLKAKNNLFYIFMINHDEKISDYKSCKSNIRVVEFNEEFYKLILKTLRWRTPPMFLLRDKNGNIIVSGINEKSLKKVISR